MTTHYRSLPASSEATPALSVDQEVAIKSPYGTIMKRIFDLVAVLLSLPFIIPLIALLALLVAHDGGRPFYSQNRIGRGGRVYRIWKMRTMVQDADAHLEAYLAGNPDARSEWDVLQKLKSDPRITRFGRILRKSSLDELPQLWNVLVGDMSLVGPRPMMCDQKSMYPGKAYYDLRPGITGYWQISDRNEGSFSERADFDTRYAADLSFQTDMRVLVSTVRVVLHGTGY